MHCKRFLDDHAFIKAQHVKDASLITVVKIVSQHEQGFGQRPSETRPEALLDGYGKMGSFCCLISFIYFILFYFYFLRGVESHGDPYRSAAVNKQAMTWLVDANNNQ